MFTLQPKRRSDDKNPGRVSPLRGPFGKEKDMTEKSGTRKIIGAGRRFYLLALLAIVFTAAPILAAQAGGSAQCPIPQKRSSAMKQPKSSAAPKGVRRPPIDLAIPARTETATFAMG
jgi:hypothetical protein